MIDVCWLASQPPDRCVAHKGPQEQDCECGFHQAPSARKRRDRPLVGNLSSGAGDEQARSRIRLPDARGQAAQRGAFASKSFHAHTQINHLIKKCMAEYIDTTASAHSFRAMSGKHPLRFVFTHRIVDRQVSESKRFGISAQAHKAMCNGRLHSEAVAGRYYEKNNLKRYVAIVKRMILMVRF